MDLHVLLVDSQILLLDHIFLILLFLPSFSFLDKEMLQSVFVAHRLSNINLF